MFQCCSLHLSHHLPSHSHVHKSVLYACVSIAALQIGSSVHLSRFHACEHAKSLQSCLTLYYPMDYIPLAASIHGILQARILEWVAMPSSPLARNSPWTEEPAKLSSPWELQRVAHDWATNPYALAIHHHLHIHTYPSQKELLIYCLCRFLYILHMGGILFTIRIIFHCTTYHILFIRLVIGGHLFLPFGYH